MKDSKKNIFKQRAWVKLMMRGIPQNIREAFDSGYDAGFENGLRVRKKQDQEAKQLKFHFF